MVEPCFIDCRSLTVRESLPFHSWKVSVLFVPVRSCPVTDVNEGVLPGPGNWSGPSESFSFDPNLLTRMQWLQVTVDSVVLPGGKVPSNWQSGGDSPGRPVYDLLWQNNLFRIVILRKFFKESILPIHGSHPIQEPEACRYHFSGSGFSRRLM